MRMLGHDGPPEAFWRENLLTGKPLDRCPVRTLQLADPALTREMDMMRLEVYPAWQQGHLLSAGGIEDQSARYLEFMRTFDTTKHLVQLKHNELRPEESSE
jgi:hypothetical protein